MALLELEHVAAGYVEGIDILGDITLRVEPGSITGVMPGVHTPMRPATGMSIEPNVV